MTHEELARFVAAIPELTHHRFMDTDGEFSTKIHSAEEVAQRVAAALLAVCAVVPLDHMIVRGEEIESP